MPRERGHGTAHAAKSSAHSSPRVLDTVGRIIDSVRSGEFDPALAKQIVNGSSNNAEISAVFFDRLAQKLTQSDLRDEGRVEVLFQYIANIKSKFQFFEPSESEKWAEIGLLHLHTKSASLQETLVDFFAVVMKKDEGGSTSARICAEHFRGETAADAPPGLSPSTTRRILRRLGEEKPAALCHLLYEYLEDEDSWPEALDVLHDMLLASQGQLEDVLSERLLYAVFRVLFAEPDVQLPHVSLAITCLAAIILNVPRSCAPLLGSLRQVFLKLILVPGDLWGKSAAAGLSARSLTRGGGSARPAPLNPILVNAEIPHYTEQSAAHSLAYSVDDSRVVENNEAVFFRLDTTRINHVVSLWSPKQSGPPRRLSHMALATAVEAFFHAVYAVAPSSMLEWARDIVREYAGTKKIFKDLFRHVRLHVGLVSSPHSEQRGVYWSKARHPAAVSRDLMAKLVLSEVLDHREDFEALYSEMKSVSRGNSSSRPPRRDASHSPAFESDIPSGGMQMSGLSIPGAAYGSPDPRRGHYATREYAAETPLFSGIDPRSSSVSSCDEEGLRIHHLARESRGDSQEKEDHDTSGWKMFSMETIERALDEIIRFRSDLAFVDFCDHTVEQQKSGGKEQDKGSSAEENALRVLQRKWSLKYYTLLNELRYERFASTLYRERTRRVMEALKSHKTRCDSVDALTREVNELRKNRDDLENSLRSMRRELDESHHELHAAQKEQAQKVAEARLERDRAEVALRVRDEVEETASHQGPLRQTEQSLRSNRMKMLEMETQKARIKADKYDATVAELSRLRSMYASSSASESRLSERVIGLSDQCSLLQRELELARADARRHEEKARAHSEALSIAQSRSRAREKELAEVHREISLLKCEKQTMLATMEEKLQKMQEKFERARERSAQMAPEYKESARCVEPAEPPRTDEDGAKPPAGASDPAS